MHSNTDPLAGQDKGYRWPSIDLETLIEAGRPPVAKGTEGRARGVRQH